MKKGVPADSVGQDIRQDRLDGQALGGRGGYGSLSGRGLSGLGRVLHQHSRGHGQQRTNRAEAEEAHLPAGRVQQTKERHGRQELAELPHRARQLPHQRGVAQRNPGGDQAHHGQEGRGIARSDQHAGADRHWIAGGARQDELPQRHHKGARDHEFPRPEAVDQQPHGDLRQRIHRQLQRGEYRQLCCVDVEAVDRIHAGHAEGGAPRHRQGVAQHSGCPHQQRPAAEFVGTWVVFLSCRHLSNATRR